MKEKKKKFIQVFALALIMLLIASSTYAYFAMQIGQSSSTDITVTTSTVDNLTFETGDAISISATQSNFTEGSGNQSGSTYASATLVANNDTNEASAKYYLYIKIDTNEFEYTTSDKTAELILTITDPDGNEVTSLSGLTYTSVTDGDGNTVSGFDITSKIGLITIASDYLIESTGTNTQEWNIEVTLVNLPSDQSDNAGKSFSASLLIQSSVYGNTLQAYSSGSEIWAYTGSTTKIVFDDSGSTIDTYDYVYDITEANCYYNGTEVNSGNTTISMDECSNIYKITDTAYSEDFETYYSYDYIEYYFESESLVVSWDSELGTCVIDSLDSETYYLRTWYGYTPTENECSGVAYQSGNSGYYYLGIENVGSGEYELNGVSSIYAYLINNGDDTYTVYIESDAPIISNANMSVCFYNFTSLETIEGLDKIITSNTTNMNKMFLNCTSLKTLDMGSWDTTNVTGMVQMFYNCSSLTSLDLSNATFTQVTSYGEMFDGANSSITVTVKDSSAYDFITARLSEYNGGTVVIA